MSKFECSLYTIKSNEVSAGSTLNINLDIRRCLKSCIRYDRIITRECTNNVTQVNTSCETNFINTSDSSVCNSCLCNSSTNLTKDCWNTCITYRILCYVQTIREDRISDWRDIKEVISIIPSSNISSCTLEDLRSITICLIYKRSNSKV